MRGRQISVCLEEWHPGRKVDAAPISLISRLRWAKSAGCDWLTAEAGDLATARVAASVHTAATSLGGRLCMKGMLPASRRMLQQGRPGQRIRAAAEWGDRCFAERRPLLGGL